MTSPRVDRRRILQGALAGAALAPLAPTLTLAAEGKSVTNGRIKQSIVYWCFNAMGDKWSAEKTCEVAKALGVPSIEIIPPEDWPTLKKHGLTCAIAPNGMPGAPFMKGFNN